MTDNQIHRRRTCLNKLLTLEVSTIRTSKKGSVHDIMQSNGNTAVGFSSMRFPRLAK